MIEFKVGDKITGSIMPRIEMTMSAGFQFTAPSALRKEWGLNPGDKIIVDTDRNTVEKAETQEEQVKRVFAELDRLKAEREAKMTLEQKKFAEMSAGWTVNQYREYFDNLPETKAYIKEKYGVEVK